MVNFRFVSAIGISSLIFLLGIFLGQAISYYNLSELKQSQENILSDLVGYELAYSILLKQDICNIDFSEIQKERAKLGQKVSDLEEKLGPKNPELLIEKERYQIYQIKEYVFFEKVKEQCNISIPLILYFYSHPCDECIAQGHVLDALSGKYNLTTIYALDYKIDNPVLEVINKKYNITSTPSLVINGKTYNKFLTLQELEGIINEKIVYNKPYITFTFDDGYEDIFTNALPIFKKHNISATSYTITGLVGKEFENQKLMNWSQIRELQKNGFEIGSHTINHSDLTELDSSSITKELKSSKETLIEQGFNVTSLSIPYGKYNNEIEEIAKKYYSSVRPSIWGFNSISNIDRYKLKSIWIVNSTSIEEIKGWVDEAKANNYWLIFMLHLVREDKNSKYSISPKDLEETISYIKSKNIEIKTISEVMDLY